MFYDKFLKLCEEKNVKPSRVAVEMNFNKGSISSWKKKYEEGIDVQVSSDILCKLASYFDVSVDYLLGQTNARKTTTIEIDTNVIKAALFKGSKEVTDDMWNEVVNFAKYIEAREAAKDKKDE